MSDTHHSRMPGTHRAWSGRDRHYFEDGYSEPRGVKRLTWRGLGGSDTEAIAEGLAEHEGVEYAYGPECDWDDLMVPVVAIEPEPLSWHSDEHDTDADHSADWEDDAYYGNPAERVDVYVDTDGEEYHAGPVEDLDDDEDWSSWLPLMTYDEACEELNYGFTIEGPSVSSEPPKREAYIRVYELARQLEVDSKPLVAHLRGIGEYVLGHQSWVALPVARALMNDEAAVASLGERTTPSTGTQRLDALIREEARRASMPRPRNPFLHSTYAPNLYPTRVQ